MRHFHAFLPPSLLVVIRFVLATSVALRLQELFIVVDIIAEMAPVSSDVDEIIETEVCNRLIRLSCAKMVNSKSERGGAKLHRNLLILHLLRKARDEQKRLIFNCRKISRKLQ